jgi:prepilin-type N-terminal cleavage/methylation domain-containing protein
MVKRTIIMDKQKGFSLVELSVVLVIIGVVVGIVAAGVTIQKTSELRSIISQIDYFRVAIEGFDDKYQDLPGDMSDAHDYWDDGADGVCGTASQCNGNGDGDIQQETGGNDDDDYEVFRAWQHLYLAGFIDGEYSGEGVNNLHIPYENCPGTARSGGGYRMETVTNNTIQMAGNIISVGGYSTTWPQGEFLTPSEAFYIDTKTDDGDPDDGKTHTRGHSGGTAGCVAGSDPNRTYLKQEEDSLCIMFFSIR